MPISPITQRGQIRSSHAVREDFAAKSTGNQDGTGRTGYYETKGHAMRKYDDALRAYDICLGYEAGFDMPGDDGRVTLDVWTTEGNWDDCSGEVDCVGCAVIMWHRMESGRYEFTGYLA